MRIAFFTERLPPHSDPISRFSYQLISSLADQSHDIRIFSTYQHGAEIPPSHPRIEVLRPFRNWNWLEVPRLLPLLLDFKPDVLHFIQPHKEAIEGFTNAMSALPALSPLIGAPAIVSTFYDLQPLHLKTHRIILLASHAITVSSAPQVGLLARFLDGYGREPEVALLPVPSSIATASDINPARLVSPVSETLMQFLDADHELIYVPGDVSDQQNPALLFQSLAQLLCLRSRAAIVFGGAWGKTPQRRRFELMRLFGDQSDQAARVLFTGGLNDSLERLCLAKAQLVFAAGLASESFGLTRILRVALEAKTPVMMSYQQAQIDALPWRNGENALIARPNGQGNGWTESLLLALGDPARLRHIRAQLSEFSRQEAIDQPSNVVSRIYARIGARRRTGQGLQT